MNIVPKEKEKKTYTKQEKIRILHQWCSNCSKAYDFTCSGKNAQKCNEQKDIFLKS